MHGKLGDRVNISDLTTGDYIQNRTAAGLFAYGSNLRLRLLSDCNFSQTTFNQINKGFGTNGINGDGSIPLSLDGSNDGFNISLTLWALTVASKIAPPCRPICYRSPSKQRLVGDEPGLSPDRADCGRPSQGNSDGACCTEYVRLWPRGAAPPVS